MSSPAVKRQLFTNQHQRPNPSKKTVILIRHGQSLGQIASTREARRVDKRLTDCGLTKLGIQQATSLRNDNINNNGLIDLVVSSPLTRALQTALLGFPGKPILIAYDLREVGSMIPENIPRPISKVIKDLVQNDEETKALIDYTTLQPDKWPNRHDTPPKVVRKDRIRQFFVWLARNRPERTIVVVCHYHVIRTALSSPTERTTTSMTTLLRPENCDPIFCELDEDGILEVTTTTREDDE